MLTHFLQFLYGGVKVSKREEEGGKIALLTSELGTLNNRLFNSS
jgi:hypothetical protein